MKIKDLKRVPKQMTSIGGQAVIEGVMMRGPGKMAVAVRRPDNEIELKEEEVKTLGQRYPLLGLPFIRGFVSLVESMVLGTRILTYSAEFIEEEEEDYEEGALDRFLEGKSENFVMAATVAFSFFISILLFMVLPNLITSLFKNRLESVLALNLIEGLVRILIFLVYLILVSRMEDMKRIFQYHGAEHKTIHCYENGDELTVENAKNYPILHPRCGTSFLFMVMLVSILVLSFFGWPNPIKRLVTRILMFPVIAAISYEINRLIGRSGSRLASLLSYPGLYIQKLATVKEPDEKQLEVALEALKAVLVEDGSDIYED